MLKHSSSSFWMWTRKKLTRPRQNMKPAKTHGWLGRHSAIMSDFRRPLQLARVEVRISFGRSQMNLAWSNGHWLQWHSRLPVKIWHSKRIIGSRLMVLRYYDCPELSTTRIIASSR